MKKSQIKQRKTRISKEKKLEQPALEVVEDKEDNSSLSIPSFNYSDVELLHNLETLNSQLSALIDTEHLPTLSPSDIMTQFEAHESQKEPENISQRFLKQREQEENDFQAFLGSLETKQTNWAQKKRRFIHDSHVSTVRSVCIFQYLCFFSCSSN